MKKVLKKIFGGFVVVGLLTGCREKNAETKSDAARTNPIVEQKIASENAATNRAEKIRPLMVGGGASHDFARWFNQSDSVTMAVLNNASVDYTEKLEFVLPMLKDHDALYLCANQKIEDPAIRKGIFDFADAGKGLILVHPALWYNWKDWPEYNRVLVGGGANSHDKYGEFEVTVTEPNHPVMAGVPKTFKTSDELYHFEQDKNGTPIQVLATGKSPLTGETFPVVWITKHPKTRIVCITLGHDGVTHDSEPYRAILKNSLNWVTAKK